MTIFTLVLPENRLGPSITFEVLLQKGDFCETAAEAAEKGSVDRMGGRCQGVKDPFAFPARLDQPRTAQVGKMARDLRLRDAQNALELTNTVFALREEIQETDAGRISKRFE